MNALQRMKLTSLKKKAHKYFRLRDEGDPKAREKEIEVQKDLAHFYEKHAYDKDIPHADILAQECFRHSALLGDADGQYIFSERMMEKANFWNDFSKGIYGAQIHAKYATLYYEEAHSFLSQAEAQGHPLAKRLHGLAYMKGWGLNANTEMGAKLIIESIKDEDAWDRATEIFEELGLHSPDIFTSLMAHAKQPIEK